MTSLTALSLTTCRWLSGIFSLGQSRLTGVGFMQRSTNSVGTRPLAMFSYIDNFRLPLARSDGILSGSALDSGCLVGWHNGPVAKHAARGWAYLRVAIYRYPFVALDSSR